MAIIIFFTDEGIEANREQQVQNSTVIEEIASELQTISLQRLCY